MLSVHGLALCQAGTLQLTLPVYFLKRRPSTPSQLMGWWTGSAHSCVYFHWVPGWGGNCNSAMKLDLVSPEKFYSRFIDHSDHSVFYHGQNTWNNQQFTLFESSPVSWWWTPCVLLRIKTKLSCWAEMKTLTECPTTWCLLAINTPSFSPKLYTNILNEPQRMSTLWYIVACKQIGICILVRDFFIYDHVWSCGVSSCSFLIDCKHLSGNCLSISVLRHFLYLLTRTLSDFGPTYISYI